jgi:hypothetical protein
MEEWKSVPDFPAYTVSNFGNVRTTHKNRDALLVLKDRGEYKVVRLCNKGVEKTCQVHRLVAEAFIPPVEGKIYIDHINRNKHDNNVTNLRWVNRSENGLNRERRICETGERYIHARKRSKKSNYQVSMPFLNCRRDCATLEQAVKWRNERLAENNMLDRL